MKQWELPQEGDCHEKIFQSDQEKLPDIFKRQRGSVFFTAVHADCTDADGGISGKYE